MDNKIGKIGEKEKRVREEERERERSFMTIPKEGSE